MNMETIMHYFNLGIKTYCDFLLNFCLNWLHHSPLKNLHEAYLYLFAGTIIVIFTIIPLILLSHSIEIVCSEGQTIKNKFQSFCKKRRNRIIKYDEEWDKDFIYDYMIQLNYIACFFILAFAFWLKSFKFLYIGIPYLILVIIHNKNIMTKLNYKLTRNLDLFIDIICIYISLILSVHFFIHYNLK